MAKGPQQGDRYGDWYLESRAKPINGKRYWNVTNTVTDAKAVVAQTDLANLNNADFQPEDAVPSSAEITARVLAGNHAANPFAVPAGAFEPVFREPSVIATVTADGQTDEYLSDGTVVVAGVKFTKIGDNPFGGQVSAGFDDSSQEGVEQGIVDAEMVKFDVTDPKMVTLRQAVREAMGKLAEAQTALDQVMKAAANL